MKNKLLSIVATAICFAPLAAHAVPMGYSLNFSANSGSNGTGSFTFDNDVGTITDFYWNFDGVVGGHGDLFDTTNVFGDTWGRFVFEFISQTDVHSAVNCISNGCGVGGPVSIGSGPLGATNVNLYSDYDGSVNYEFWGGQATYTSGSIAIRAAAVPEPSALMLFSIALGALGFALAKRPRTLSA